MKKTILIILIIILFCFASGFSYWLGQRQISQVPLLEKSKLIEPQRAIAQGEVTTISDRTLTLTAEEDVLEISIKEEAEITALILPEIIETEEEVTEPVQPQFQAIKFGDIKIGDRVKILIWFEDEKIEGQRVTVLPPQK